MTEIESAQMDIVVQKFFYARGKAERGCPRRCRENAGPTLEGA